MCLLVLFFFSQSCSIFSLNEVSFWYVVEVGTTSWWFNFIALNLDYKVVIT